MGQPWLMIVQTERYAFFICLAMDPRQKHSGMTNLRIYTQYGISPLFICALTLRKPDAILPIDVKGKPFERMGHKAIGP